MYQEKIKYQKKVKLKYWIKDVVPIHDQHIFTKDRHEFRGYFK